jgi:hypothetical protein
MGKKKGRRKESLVIRANSSTNLLLTNQLMNSNNSKSYSLDMKSRQLPKEDIFQKNKILQGIVEIWL